MRGFEFVAILTATLFSGAAIYINLWSILPEWIAEQSSRQASLALVTGEQAVMQAIRALTTATIAGISAWLMGAPALLRSCDP
jgi:hypothetical protein